MKPHPLAIPLAIILLTLQLRAADLPPPVFHETMDGLKPETDRVELNTPTELGPGKIGDAVLLERRTENLLKEANFPAKDTRSWVMLNGVVWQPSEGDHREVKGMMVVPQGGMLRQVTPSLTAEKLYCFSVYARAAGAGAARLSLEWGGSEESNLKEFEVAKEWKRMWVAGRSLGGAATPTVKGLAGRVEIERPQFETGSTFPTSFIVKGPRGVSGMVWRGEGTAPLFNATQGTVSLWIKPNWAGETADTGFSIFAMHRDPEEDWKTAHSAMILNAWLLKPTAKDWQYALNLTIGDQDGKQKGFSIPAQELKPEWHHIAIVWNLVELGKSLVAVYLDGKQALRNESLPLQGMEGIRQVTFGRSGGGYLDGWLDEVRIYDQALGEDAIRELAKGGGK